MADDIQTISPIAALAASGDLPRPSVAAAPATAAPAEGEATTGLLDAEKTPFDKARHQVDMMGAPKRTAKGTWAKKTGNGARKLLGKPQAGRLVRGSMLPPPAKADSAAEQPGAPAAAAVEPLPGGSTFNPGPTPTPGETGAVDAVEATLPMLTPEECRPTAESVIDGALGMAKMLRGDHWAANDRERSQLVDSVSRLWSVYNLPRLGPVVQLVMVLLAFVVNGEKRKEDMKKMWTWLLGKKPVIVQPEEKPAP